MIIRNLSLSLILATLGLSWPAIPIAGQSKVIVIAPSDCKPTEVDLSDSLSAMSIHVNAENILFDFGGTAMSCLFTDEGLILIAHEAKVYSVQSYDELKATHSRQVDEGDSYHKRTGKWLGNREFIMTDETATISGLTTHKVIQMIGDKIEAEIWVSIESVPIRLRERMKSTYQEDHWKKASLKPWITDIIMLYGVPVKMVEKRKSGILVCEARVFEESISANAFQVPSGYRRESELTRIGLTPAWTEAREPVFT